MPPLSEGSILYMPTTLPGIAIGEAQRCSSSRTGSSPASPEVERVYGKAGRAETTTDPAPLSMFRDHGGAQAGVRHNGQRRPGTPRGCRRFARPLVRPFWPDRISHEELVAEMNRALAMPGFTNAWTMPIKARIDMLSTGVRTPVGIKVLGRDLEGDRARRRGGRSGGVRDVPGAQQRRRARRRRVFSRSRAEARPAGALRPARRGAPGGARGGDQRRERHHDDRGRQRFPVSVRYPRDLRDDPTGCSVCWCR